MGGDVKAAGRKSACFQELPDDGGGDTRGEGGVVGDGRDLLFRLIDDVDCVRGLAIDNACELPAASQEDRGAAVTAAGESCPAAVWSAGAGTSAATTQEARQVGYEVICRGIREGTRTGMWIATRRGSWDGTQLATRQGTGQGALVVACTVADEVAVEIAEQVARVVPRDIPRVVTSETTGIATGEA
jgi:hypothetical protein